MFNGNGDVIAIGCFWENQFIDALIRGNPALALAITSTGIIALGFEMIGNGSISTVCSHAGTIHTGNRLPRPIGCTRVTIAYNRTCVN